MTHSGEDERGRLDRLLVERGHFATRARARDAILRGTVTVDGRLATKPALPCDPAASVRVADPAAAYVSRAALKLKAALSAFDVPVRDAICLDLGASTGGFTQVLLEAGAATVHAVDVGHGQMAPPLRDDGRVRLTEGLNARDLKAADLGGARPSVIVCDVSFISLRLALPPALALAAPGGHLVALVKPQFEVGRERIGKGGLVRPDDAQAAAGDLAAWLDARPGWTGRGVIPSPVAGSDGNAEFLLGGVRDG